MPGPSGIEVAQRLQQTGAAVPVVLMSGYSEDVVDLRHFDAKTTFLSKPIAQEDLQKLLEKLGLAWDIQVPRNLPPREGITAVRENAEYIFNKNRNSSLSECFDIQNLNF